MSWSRFDDAYVQRTVWEHLDLAARWHYLCLVQECSRNDRFDGRMPWRTALRASDVDDPEAAINALETVSLVEVSEELGDLKVVGIAEHLPPPSVRENAEKSKVRMARMRKHKAGDHAECLPDHCDHAVPTAGPLSVGAPAVTRNATSNEPSQTSVTPTVTRNTGTGQDGQQQQVPTEGDVTVTRNSETYAPPPTLCPHGMENGDQYDNWLKDISCPQCRATRKAAS